MKLTGNWNSALADTLSTQQIADDVYRSLRTATMPAFEGVTSAAQTLARQNATTLAGIAKSASAVNVSAITDALGVLRSTDFGAWNTATKLQVASFTAGVRPLLDQQVKIAAAMPTAAVIAHWDQLTASLSHDLADTALLSARADLLASTQASLGVLRLPRLGLLADSFVADTGSSADALGKLYRDIHKSERLGHAVDEAIAATQQRGAFGFNQSGVRDHIRKIEQILDDDPAEGRRLTAAVEEAQETAGFDDELMFSLDELIGLVRGIKQHEFSAIGAVGCLTMGVTAFVVGYAVAPGEAPLHVISGVVAGGTTYSAIAKFVNRHKPRDGK